jgi:hypothetical protein
MAVTLSVTKSETVSHTETIGSTRVSLVNKSDTVVTSTATSLAVSVAPNSVASSQTVSVAETTAASVLSCYIYYDLICGKCGHINQKYVSWSPVFAWYCDYCDNTDQGVVTPNETSLPTLSDNLTLVTNPLLAKSINHISWL